MGDLEARPLTTTPPSTVVFSIRLESSDRDRAVDPHSFYVDPDPTVLQNADPDPATVLF